jgi:hypothetical protein
VRVGLVFGDLLRHEARAFNGVDDQQMIADAFAAVGAEVAGPDAIGDVGGTGI